MNIAEAFTQEAIEYTDTNLDGDEEEQVRAMIAQVYGANELAYVVEHENVGLLCFIAGRAYQKSLDTGLIEITMTPAMVQDYLEYLTQRSQS